MDIRVPTPHGMPLAKPRGVPAALMRAIPFLFSARMVAVVFVPLLVAALLWSVVGWFALEPLARILGEALFGATNGWGMLGAAMLSALLLMLAAVLTALVAIAVLAMPVIVEGVAARDFAMLERRRGGTFAGSIANALVALAVFLPLWVLALVLLAVPPIYVGVALLLSAWLNQRLFRHDALALHAGRDEMAAVIKAARGRLFLLGLLLAPLSLIPVANFIAPLYAGIAFSYLCLDELAVLRANGATDPTTKNS
jgi:CysZ protein